MKAERRFQWRDQALIALVALWLGAISVLFDSFEESRQVDGLGLALGFGMGYLGWRAWRAGAIARQHDLVIRNLFSTKRLRWSRIGSFEVGRFRLVDRPVAVVRLTDGTSTPISSFCALAPSEHAMARVAKVVDELNAENTSRQTE